jgi:hypothetical protein
MLQVTLDILWDEHEVPARVYQYVDHEGGEVARAAGERQRQTSNAADLG